MTKTKWMFAAATAIVLAAAPLLAQPHGFGPAGGRLGIGSELLAGYLDLTEAQKAQAKTIVDAAAAAAKPVHEQLRESREAFHKAIKSGTASDPQFQQLADAQGKLISQLIALHARTASKLYALLTPEQRAKADQLHETVRTRLHQRFGAMRHARPDQF